MSSLTSIFETREGMPFCQNCGNKLTVGGFFCHVCGKQSAVKPDGPDAITLSTSRNTTDVSSLVQTSAVPASTLSFEEFKKRKESSRCSLFTAKKKKVSNEEAKMIQVGVVHLVDGSLRRMKGRTLPVSTSPSMDVKTLIQAAVEKHGKHFQQFDVSHDYVLLYPDYTLVNMLPGTMQDFSLGAYKEDLGKSYAKIYLWLCKRTDYEVIAYDHSESDFEETHLPPAFGDRSLSSKAIDIEPQSGPIVVDENNGYHSSVSANSGDAPESNIFHDGRENRATAFCPTCFKTIPIGDIEEHADICADHFDPVGEISNSALETEMAGNEHETQFERDMSSACTTQRGKEQRMKEFVTQLQTNIDKESRTRINVRRRNLFQDFLEIRKKPWFKVNGLLKVTFVGEPAIDDGGPRREFFSEILHQVQERLLPNGVPVRSFMALTNEEFKVSGELMLLSLAQGGPSPSILALEVYEYITGGAASVTSEAWTSQLSPELKTLIDKISQANTDSELQRVLMEDLSLEHLSNIGYRGVPTKETIPSRESIIRSLVMGDLTKVLPMLDQLSSGLNTFGLLETIKSNRSALQPLFVKSENFVPDADYMLDALHGDFSEDGCNKKPQEIDIFKYFSDYITEVGFSVTSEEKETLPNLFKFITGTDSIPPLGLPNGIMVKFKHHCDTGCKCRPTASTCDVSITFPLHYADYQDFKDSLSSALMEGFGFGLI